MEWIKINEDGEVELLMEEVKLVPELVAMNTRAYNKAAGDHEGRLKKRVKQELKYLYLAYSLKSPYKDYSSKERIEEARKDCNFPEGWEESEELKLLIHKYTKANPSRITRLLHTAENTVDKLRDFLDEIDLSQKDEYGKLVHTTASVLKTLEQLPAVAQTLAELERQSRTDIIHNTKTRGDQELGWMASTKINYGTTHSDPGHSEEDPGEVQ